MAINFFPPPLMTNGSGSSAAVVRKTQEMPNRLTSFIDNVWDEEDFEESLVALEGIIGSSLMPTPSHIHQLLSLCISPLACLPPPTSRKSSRKLANPSPDPFPTTVRKIRNEALRLLEEINANSGEGITRALPGYVAEPSLLAGGEGKKDSEEKKPVINGNANGNGKKKVVAKKEKEVFDEDEDYKEISLAGMRISRFENCWDMLGDGIGRGKLARKRCRERVVFGGEGWEVLRSLVGVWESEASNRNGDEFLAPSLLRQFKPAQAGIVRTCSISCFELILWPFEDYHLTETAEGEEEDAIDSDEPNLEEKQKVVVRLVKLLIALSMGGYLDSQEFIRELVTRLNSLSVDSFTTFLTLLKDFPPLFLIRLYTTYLQTFSHDSSFVPLPAAPATGGSPRRRQLGQNSTLSSTSLLESQSSTNSTVPITAPAYSTLPPLSTILTLLSKIPSSVPLSPLPTVASKRKSSSNSKPSFASAKKAAETHEVLKKFFLEAVLDLAEMQGGARVEEALIEDGKAEKALEGVRKVVEEARVGVEGA